MFLSDAKNAVYRNAALARSALSSPTGTSVTRHGAGRDARKQFLPGEHRNESELITRHAQNLPRDYLHRGHLPLRTPLTSPLPPAPAELGSSCRYLLPEAPLPCRPSSGCLLPVLTALHMVIKEAAPLQGRTLQKAGTCRGHPRPPVPGPGPGTQVLDECRLR